MLVEVSGSLADAEAELIVAVLEETKSPAEAASALGVRLRKLLEMVAAAGIVERLPDTGDPLSQRAQLESLLR